jgi:hypothetical protein
MEIATFHRVKNATCVRGASSAFAVAFQSTILMWTPIGWRHALLTMTSAINSAKESQCTDLISLIKIALITLSPPAPRTSLSNA